MNLITSGAYISVFFDVTVSQCLNIFKILHNDHVFDKIIIF